MRHCFHFQDGIFFSALKDKPFCNGVITFSKCNANSGNGMNPNTGEFTTPISGSGFYAFTFTGSSKCKEGKIEVSVLKNDEKQHSFHQSAENASVHLSGSWMFELNQGDIVSLKATSTLTNDDALSQGTFDTLFKKKLKKY